MVAELRGASAGGEPCKELAVSNVASELHSSDSITPHQSLHRPRSGERASVANCIFTRNNEVKISLNIHVVLYYIAKLNGHK